MTAVAPPPSFVQSGSRPAWAAGHQGSSMSMTQMTPEEVSRLLMPPRSKTSTRSSSSSASSISSSSSSSSSASSVTSNDSVGSTPSSTPSSSWAKKKTRSAWPGKQDANMRSTGINGIGGGSGVGGGLGGGGPAGGSILNLSTSSLTNGVSTGSAAAAAAAANAAANGGGSFLMLLPLNGTFERKVIPLPFFPDVLRIGRQTNAKTLPTPSNGYFDSKVLSRQHAEIWAEKGTGRVFLKDIKSSNGTFVNGTRLSPENRESEPQELRAEDILELGIDIVGEDNKTIVHHKVAARVEHAGFHHGGLGGAAPGPFDLNFGDIDPIMGGLMAPPLNHIQTNANRSRSNSQTSRGSVTSFANGGNGVQHRPGQIMSALPITIESLVKKIHFELQQAKQQSQELKRTNDYLDKVMEKKLAQRKNIGNLKKETDPDTNLKATNDTAPAPSVSLANGHLEPLMNGVDYPDTAAGHDIVPGLVAKENMANGIIPASTDLPSPKDSQPQQIQNLVAALVSVKKDLDQKSKQVMYLEESLRIERMARESAEERAERLEQSSLASRNATISPATAKLAENELGTEAKASSPALPSAEEMQQLVKEASERAAAAATAAADSLRNQLREMVLELQNAKADLDSYKQRVQDAEREGNEAKTSLRELVEKVKREEEERTRQAELLRRNQNGSAIKEANGADPLIASKGLANGVGLVGGRGRTEGGVMGHVIGMTTERFIDKDGNKVSDFAKQGAPYMSMLGVVIFGVGLMVVINSWQKGER